MQTQNAVVANVPAIIGHFTAHSVQKPSATTGVASQLTSGGFVAGPPNMSRGRKQRALCIKTAGLENRLGRLNPRNGVGPNNRAVKNNTAPPNHQAKKKHAPQPP